MFTCGDDVHLWCQVVVPSRSPCMPVILNIVLGNQPGTLCPRRYDLVREMLNTSSLALGGCEARAHMQSAA